MKKLLIIFTAMLIWTCSSSSSKPTEPTVPTQPPTVNNLTLTTNEDTPTTFTMTGTDPGNFALTFSIATQPQHGTLTTSGSSGTYTPKANYNGEDIFGFIATNGTLTSTAGIATITIAPVDDDPNTMNVSAVTDEDNAVEIILEAEEYDGDTISFNIKDNPTSGTVSLTGDKATYTPNENYFGSDSFTFEAVDTTAKKILNTATASITINPVNDAPAVEDMQEVEGVEDTELTITLTGTDIDGDNLSFEVDTAPTQGSITENGTTFTYTPTQDFYGADSLTYRAYDGTEYSDAKKIPLFIDRGSRDWPFIFHYPGSLTSIETRPHNWEGKMFDYDSNGLADMIGFTYQVLIAEEVSDYKSMQAYNRTYTIDVLSSIPEEIIGDDPTYWQAGTAEFGHINNDGIIDMFLSIQREYCPNWPNCEHDTGPSVIGISNGVGYDWQLVNEEIKFWQDGNIEFADIDNDGDVDIIAQDNEAYKVEKDYLIVFKNDGNNNFTEERIQLDQQVSLEEFRVKDIDKDGYNDIIGFGGGGTGFLHILYGTSQWDKFDYFELDFGAQEADGFYDVTIVDLENDNSYEILTIRVVSAGFPELILEKHLFRSNGSRAYQMDEATQFSGTIYGQVGPIPKTQAWDFDDDGDKDIFIHYFNEWRPEVVYADPGPTGDDGTGCCYCWHRDFESQANGTLNRGYFWKNNDGILEKTFFNIREDECTFNSFYGFE